VNTTQVTFPNEKTGLKLAGLVFTPKNMKPNAKLTAVVVGGPMFSVKEQTQSLYAQHLAKLGYVAIVFDHTYYGESEGEPRRYEDPFMKSEDIKSAVSYLETLPYVDTERSLDLGSAVLVATCRLPQLRITVSRPLYPSFRGAT
jgi:fermentation-respiration switch protein FrsA (DUF1100 family)